MNLTSKQKRRLVQILPSMYWRPTIVRVSKEMGLPLSGVKEDMAEVRGYWREVRSWFSAREQHRVRPFIHTIFRLYEKTSHQPK